MALPSSIDLTKLRPGVKVRLGGEKEGPRKPYPVGWVEVVQVPAPMLEQSHVRVVGDDRWVPVSLIEEIAEP